jgi:hypothetical protein
LSPPLYFSTVHKKNPHANRHEDFKNKTIQANAGIREPENYLSLGSFTSVGIFKPEKPAPTVFSE